MVRSIAMGLWRENTATVTTASVSMDMERMAMEARGARDIESRPEDIEPDVFMGFTFYTTG